MLFHTQRLKTDHAEGECMDRNHCRESCRTKARAQTRREAVVCAMSIATISASFHNKPAGQMVCCLRGGDEEERPAPKRRSITPAKHCGRGGAWTPGRSSRGRTGVMALGAEGGVEAIPVALVGSMEGAIEQRRADAFADTTSRLAWTLAVRMASLMKNSSLRLRNSGARGYRKQAEGVWQPRRLVCGLQSGEVPRRDCGVGRWRSGRQFTKGQSRERTPSTAAIVQVPWYQVAPRIPATHRSRGHEILGDWPRASGGHGCRIPCQVATAASPLVEKLPE